MRGRGQAGLRERGGRAVVRMEGSTVIKRRGWLGPGIEMEVMRAVRFRVCFKD